MAAAASQIPFQSAPEYPGHVLYTLNDGNVLPSPSYGLGTANFNQDASNATLLALQNGWLHLDNARVYGNEQSCKHAIARSGIDREKLYVTTKYDALQGKDVRSEFQESLKDLGVDYVDLYLIHFPRAATAGGGIEAVWTEMEKIKEEGLARSIGVSNYQVKDLEELLAFARVKPAVNQIQYHVYNAAANIPVLALCEKHGIVVESYSGLTPITKQPGGPADAVQHKIAARLSKKTGRNITETQVSLSRIFICFLNNDQVIQDWLRTQGIVAVT